MPYSLLTLETESMFLCLYVIIALYCCKFRLNVNSEATEMAPETARGILYYYPRRTEACRGVRGRPDPRRDLGSRRSGLFEVKRVVGAANLIFVNYDALAPYYTRRTRDTSRPSIILIYTPWPLETLDHQERARAAQLHHHLIH